MGLTITNSDTVFQPKTVLRNVHWDSQLGSTTGSTSTAEAGKGKSSIQDPLDVRANKSKGPNWCKRTYTAIVSQIKILWGKVKNFLSYIFCCKCFKGGKAKPSAKPDTNPSAGSQQSAKLQQLSTPRLGSTDQLYSQPPSSAAKREHYFAPHAYQPHSRSSALASHQIYGQGHSRSRQVPGMAGRIFSRDGVSRQSGVTGTLHSHYQAATNGQPPHSISRHAQQDSLTGAQDSQQSELFGKDRENSSRIFQSRVSSHSSTDTRALPSVPSFNGGFQPNSNLTSPLSK